ncbi:thioesterase [Mangrovactinospora gilvigrisea]|uniref:Thioesterase n=1 Tax=Mangrovactinospora gilvigrisea TaxID=1428644 RepID=A0A1J7BC78_9ACTN|nr:thioesterase family protein [Mangrovactinospora gilvigrisea]OIV36275.1 thioesterase [Mangrovactinospora gilvigrisea]
MARHVYRCPLRWSDMDAYQHVNNTVFLRYLEEARIDFMFTVADSGGVEFRSGMVVARHEIDYRRPLVHRAEPVLVETWVEKISAASVRLGYEVKDAEEDGGVVYVAAASVLVPYDLEEKRPRRFSPEEREYLLKFQDDAPAAGAAA